MNITIIGSGKMARAISWRLLDSGHSVTLVGHTPGKAQALVDELKNRGNGEISIAMPDTLPGELVILAVPYSAVPSLIRQYTEQLPGKILVDITNPVDYQKMEPTVTGSSAAEEIAKLAPEGTSVVKAFNTVFAKSLLSEQVNCAPLDVFIAGDDAHAKEVIAQLVVDIRLHPMDVGPLIRSRQLEAMELLHLAIQTSNNLGFRSAIRIVP